MTHSVERTPTGAEIITEFLKHSPFVAHLGMRLDHGSFRDLLQVHELRSNHGLQLNQ